MAFRDAGFTRRDLWVCFRAWLDLFIPVRQENLSSPAGHDGGDFVKEAQAVQRLVDYLARTCPHSPSCLRRVRALSRLLNRRRIPYRIVIGWAEKAAHAWVEVNGTVIGEHPRDRYQPLGALQNLSPLN